MIKKSYIKIRYSNVWKIITFENIFKWNFDCTNFSCDFQHVECRPLQFGMHIIDIIFALYFYINYLNSNVSHIKNRLIAIVTKANLS